MEYNEQIELVLFFDKRNEYIIIFVQFWENVS